MLFDNGGLFFLALKTVFGNLGVMLTVLGVVVGYAILNAILVIYNHTKY